MDKQGKITANSANIGLNLDSSLIQIKPGSLTYALNATNESFDGEYINYSNEVGNIECITFPEGFKVVGVKNIIQISRVVYWITNPTTGASQIGYSDNDECTYHTLIEDTFTDKLNLSVHYPIFNPIVKSTNCSTQVYWTDGLNPRRFLDFDDLPWEEKVDPNNSYKRVKLVGQLDVNKLLVQPDILIPIITLEEVQVGGALKMGTYQFAIQYSNSKGEGYTSYYSVTNPVGIYENKIGQSFDLPTSKAINLSINNIDTSGIFDWFNLIVIETINLTSTPKIVGTFPITNSIFNYTYTGTELSKSNIIIDIAEVLQQFQYYNTAQGVAEVDNVLMWYDLQSPQELNYQQIWSNVKLGWETYRIPYNKDEAYYNGINVANLRGYMRDEVYPFEGRFILSNGFKTNSFHIPGRTATAFDREAIDPSNKDNAIKTDNCSETTTRERWQVYNTGSVTGNCPELSGHEEDPCYVGPYQYGELSFWESETRYPNNGQIWGSLANQKIRHHKFPDSLITHIHTNDASSYIFPIGIRLDIGSLYDAINASGLTTDQKNDIVGFEILRGNRTIHNSIIAKGLFNNVGITRFKDEDRNYYYPNYPYNDLRADPYFTTEQLDNHAGYRPDLAIQGFSSNESKERFTFHSPDTHFNHPSISNEGQILKIETIEYGRSLGHFVKVTDNAEYKFLTQKSLKASTALALASGFNIKQGDIDFNMGNVASSYINALDLFDKVTNSTNFGYAYHSVGDYTNFYAVPNEGYKSRYINWNQYLGDADETVEDGNLFNNFRRESSLYINTEDTLLYPHEYSNGIPVDISRFNLASSPSFQVTSTSTNIVPSTVTIQVSNVTYGSIVVGTQYNYAFGASTAVYSVKSDTLLLNSSTGKFSGSIVFNIVSGTGYPHSPWYFSLKSLSPSQPAKIDYSSASTQFANTATTTTRDIGAPGAIRESAISSYYGAVKRYLPSQWGEMYGYETIHTGYYSPLYEKLQYDVVEPVGYSGPPIVGGFYFQQFTRVPAIFGGDTYINKFALKTKLPIFRQNSVGKPNQTDIALDEAGNITYPMFWISTKPAESTIGDYVNSLVDDFMSTFDGDLDDLLKGIKPKNVKKAVQFFKDLLVQLYNTIGVKNINLDRAATEGLGETGICYMFVYGIPYFFVESTINVDYRQAFNTQEGNFYPNVGTAIPDQWLQEINVPIAFDNTYYYNQTYSKQNKEIFASHLREDYDPNKLCTTEFPNRVIWSDKSSVEENKNNWLVYRPAALYDLPKSYGSLTSIDNLKDNQLLVRFDNKSQIYNALTTIQVSRGPDAFLGNTKLFTGSIPLDLSESDLGYAGSQNRLLLKTEFGNIFTDAKRGQVILIGEQGINNLADTGMSKWFKENLPFNILSLDKDIEIDNTTNGVGLTGVYDSLYSRVIITKKDYLPLDPPHTAVFGSEYWYDPNLPPTKDELSPEAIKVQLTDSTYFKDLSWTLSYSFKTKSWISFHSYAPNYYVGFPTYFQSGRNDLESLWNHNSSFTLFNSVYGTEIPYILEYPYSYGKPDEILQSVSDYSSARKYTDFVSFYEPDETIYFNKAIVYNNQGCTGIRNLIPKPQNNLASYNLYPKYNSDSIDILLTKKDNLYNFNMLWDNVISNSSPTFISTDSFLLEEKQLNITNIDYTNRSYRKPNLRAKDAKVRLILDNRNDIKLISRFTLTETSQSYL